MIIAAIFNKQQERLHVDSCNTYSIMWLSVLMNECFRRKKWKEGSASLYYFYKLCLFAQQPLGKRHNNKSPHSTRQTDSRRREQRQQSACPEGRCSGTGRSDWPIEGSPMPNNQLFWSDWSVFLGCWGGGGGERSLTSSSSSSNKNTIISFYACTHVFVVKLHENNKKILKQKEPPEHSFPNFSGYKISCCCSLIFSLTDRQKVQCR